MKNTDKGRNNLELQLIECSLLPTNMQVEQGILRALNPVV